MGRRKGQIAMMAKNSQLVKDRNRRPGHRTGDDTFLHTTELDDGTTYNRINFQSVTEQNNLEDFLTTAEMAGRDFTAERQDIQIISEPGRDVHLTQDDLERISHAQETHRSSLQIPRRPHWDKNASKEELLFMEREAFTDWRRNLKMLEEKDHIQLTPYEKNLDFWRQLWRVIERSDVIVQIVDARNPLLFRCEDLETYVKQVDPHKTCMLLVNKADFLNQWQRERWVDYFNEAGIRAVFFSAKTEKERQEGLQQEAADSELQQEVEDEDKDEDEDDVESDQDEDENDGDEEETDITPKTSNSEELSPSCGQCSDNQTSTDNESVPGLSSLSLNETATPPMPHITATQHNTTTVPSQPPTETQSQVHTETDSNPNQQSSTDCHNVSTTSTPTATTAGVWSLGSNSAHIVSSDELLDIFRHLAHPAAAQRSEEKEIKTVGMVGYPNVGKSSTINVILEQKKLAVSATPGRTKHLQTLYVDPHLVLCDCPGLVFPSFVATKAHLVINGILPIDELRNHSPPVSLVCEQIPRAVLEATYSIMIPPPSLDEADPNRPPTSEELLTAYGAMRGFMTPRGVPDCPRASRYILKDYVKGKLLYCEPPPGLEGSEFQDKTRQREICQSNKVIASAKNKLQPKSDIDKEFFNQKRSKAHSRGVTGVSDFVRTDTLQHTSQGGLEMGDLASGQSSSMASLSSQMSGTGKSWKKHNNRNKKEKLRRLHRDLDI